MEPETQLDGFIARFGAEVAAQAHEAVAWMRHRLPNATVLVYDNYNALAIGFGTNDKVGGIVFSLAVFPRWVSLFFARGVDLVDPDGLLRGAGSKVRHIRLTDTTMLDDPRIEALIVAALAIAVPPLDPGVVGKVIVKSISARQRPRRP